VKQIIVVTPVKNESWILSRFLGIVSDFADGIVVLDQCSTDNSAEIAKGFPKVSLVRNPNPQYDEAYRQALLLKTVRERYGLGNLILALDADELPTADSLDLQKWEFRHRLKPGAFAEFPKYEILENAQLLEPNVEFFPIAFVDDGRLPQGTLIHSQRLPRNSTDSVVRVNCVKFLHLARARKYEYRSRQRFYNIVEAEAGSKPWRARALYYSPTVSKMRKVQGGEEIPLEWLEYTKLGRFDLQSLPTSQNNQYLSQSKELLETYGNKKVMWDDIWGEDLVHDNCAGGKVDKAVREAMRLDRRLLRWLALSMLGALVRMREFWKY
jgi:glycosyltransferase involved in cell wall biosynthesis